MAHNEGPTRRGVGTGNWELGLNERQIRAVLYVKKKGRITNAEYQQLCPVSMRTASRDLADLVQKRIIEQLGRTGKGTFYTLKTPERR